VSALGLASTPKKGSKDQEDPDEGKDRDDPPSSTGKTSTPYAKAKQFITFAMKMDLFLAKGADGRSVLVNLHRRCSMGKHRPLMWWIHERKEARSCAFMQGHSPE
jgi:hypothetical protein